MLFSNLKLLRVIFQFIILPFLLMDYLTIFIFLLLKNYSLLLNLEDLQLKLES